MLKILLNGSALDLPADVAINLIYENPLFVNDRIPSAHSLTGTLPPTPRNLKALGYPQRLNNTQPFREFTGVSVMFGPVKFINGVLTVTKFEGDIEYFIRGAIFADELKAGIHTASLEETTFGTGSRFTPSFFSGWGFTYRSHIEATLDGSQNTVYGPIRIKDVEWPENPIAPTLFGWYATSIMYFNYFNAHNEDFLLQYPTFWGHTVCYPLTKLAYLVEEIFGDTLVSNPFSVGELQRIFLTSTYHPLWSDIVLSVYRGVLIDSTELDDSNFMKLKSFATSMNFNALIKEVLKMLCMSLYVKGDSFEFKFNKDIIESTSKQNWTKKLIGKLAHWYDPAQQYAYGYAGINSVEKPYGISEVDNIDDLAALTVPDGEEKQVYVRNTNQLFLLRNRFDDEYTASGEAGLPGEYEFVTEVQDPGFGQAPGTAQSGFSMVSEITPLPMNIHPYWWANTGSPIPFGRWYVPEWEGDRKLRPEKPNILLYQGIRDTLTEKEDGSGGVKDQYPFLTPHNRDAYGNKLGELSLHWEGPDGLITNFHREFKAYIESDKLKARGLFKLDELDLKYLDLSEKKNIKGIDWIIEKLEVTVRRTKIEPARAHLVKAPAKLPPLAIDNDTHIYIYFDSSGSMNSTLSPLTTMRDTLLKDALLGFYNDDEDLYNERVNVISWPNERTLYALDFENAAPPEGNVIVLVFQDEAQSIYHDSTFENTERSAQYDADMATLLGRLNSYSGNYYRGIIFQVDGSADFKAFVQAMENGTGRYDGNNGLSNRSEILFKYDIPDGETPQYYLDQVTGALEELGFDLGLSSGSVGGGL